MTNPGGCEHCGQSYHEEDFGTDGNGYLILNHVCDRAVIERHRTPLPRYEHAPAHGMMRCPRCGKEIKRRRTNQRWCVTCSPIARREQDAARHKAA